MVNNSTQSKGRRCQAQAILPLLFAYLPSVVQACQSSFPLGLHRMASSSFSARDFSENANIT